MKILRFKQFNKHLCDDNTDDTDIWTHVWWYEDDDDEEDDDDDEDGDDYEDDDDDANDEEKDACLLVPGAPLL